MDILTKEDLKALHLRDNGWSLSLFMPAHRAGRETEQDRIRFKNLLREAEQRLLAKEIRFPDVQKLLKPAQDLLQDSDFWRHQSDGLALFLSAQTFRTYRLPLPFDELVVISNRFHLKPLLTFFTNDGHFYLLALSQKQIRLLEGTRHTVDEVDTEKALPAMREALQFERFDKSLQFHTGTSAAGAGTRSAVFHGHDPSDDEKARILRWFHKMDDELNKLLAGEASPLVLAGVEYLFPLYREANSYPHLVEKGIPGNPEELRAEELHAQAWPLVRPIFAESQEKASAKFAQLASAGQTSADLQETLQAAQHGRVEILFVPIGVQVWGRFDQDDQTLQIHEDHVPGDEDLLDLAAVQTMLTGGTVFAVEPHLVPDQAHLAAILRY